MLNFPPVRPLYDESYPPGVDLNPEPPAALIEDNWRWSETLVHERAEVHTGRVRPALRTIAARRNASTALVESALLRVRLARGLPVIAELPDAFADLAVTGRAAFANFRSTRPSVDSLLAATMSGVSILPSPGALTPRPTDAEARTAIRAALDRAFYVMWALRGAPGNREFLRGSLGWLAVSSEDDPPHTPVNVGNTNDQVGEIHFADLGQPVICRAALKLPDRSWPWIDIPPVSDHVFPTEAGRQFETLLHGRGTHFDDLILFIHGLGSRLEEGDRFKQRLIDYGLARGKRYAVLSIDLPGNGYSSRLDFDAVVSGRPARFDVDRFSRSSFPFLNLYRDCLAQLSNRIAGGYQYVVGGSLGGSLTLRLAERGRDGRYIHPAVIRKFFCWSPASVWESYERSQLVPPPGDGRYHYDHAKHELVRISRDRMNATETGDSRYGWFHWVQRGEVLIPGVWHLFVWVSKDGIDRAGLQTLSELYDPAWRRMFWATSHEQLIFSHQEPRDRWLFWEINRPVFISAGADDNAVPLKYWDNVRHLTGNSAGVPGRRLLLGRTGHSIAEQRPDLMASHATRFFLDAARFPAASKPVVVSRGPDKLDVVAMASDFVHHAAWDGALHDWTSRDAWKSIGGQVPPAAGLCATMLLILYDQIDVFGVGGDGRAYANQWTEDTREWTGVNNAWLDLGGQFEPGAPMAAVARDVPRSIDIFATAGGRSPEAGQVRWKNWSDTTGWGGWWGLGDDRFPPSAHVTAVERRRTQIDLFAINPDRKVMTCWRTPGGGWSSMGTGGLGRWRNIGGNFPQGARVAAVARRPEQLDLFVIGFDGSVYTSWWTEGVNDWSGLGDNWRHLGAPARGFPIGAPVTAVARRPGQLDLFAVGADGNVYTSWWTEGVADWSGLSTGWRNIGGRFPPGATVAAVARRAGQLDLFAIAGDGQMYTSWWTEGVTDWTGVGDNWRPLRPDIG